MKVVRRARGYGATGGDIVGCLSIIGGTFAGLLAGFLAGILARMYPNISNGPLIGGIVTGIVFGALIGSITGDMNKASDDGKALRLFVAGLFGGVAGALGATRFDLIPTLMNALNIPMPF